MKKITIHKILPVLLSVMLICLPILADASGLVGVVRVKGQARINGMKLPGETNVFSGDRLSTGKDSTLHIASAVGENIYLTPGSEAIFTRKNESTIVALTKGAVEFQTAGHTEAVIERYGVTIRSFDGGKAVIQVMLLEDGKIQVAALRGTAEVIGAGQSVVVPQGRTGQLVPQAETVAETGRTGAGGKTFIPLPPFPPLVWVWIAVAAGTVAAIAIPLALDNPPASPSVP